MIKYLFWDAGGTLFDTYPAVVEACRVALNGFGKDAPSEWVLALCKRTTSYGIHTLADAFSLDEETFQEHFRQSYEDIGEQYQPPFPGVEEVCRYICGIGGQNFIVTHRSRASLEALLKVHGMARYFTASIAKEDPYPRKPDPAALDALIARYALDRSQCLLIGDRDLDIVAGHRASIRTCFFGDEVHDTRPDLVITDYMALYRWLQAENAEPGAA
ncbi:MAG: HAD hydrolase-like protein [Anaerolineae bacterium]